MSSATPNITFITGNQKKAEYLKRYLGHPAEHMKLELDEAQLPKKFPFTIGIIS